jgi:hypothetical protein
MPFATNKLRILGKKKNPVTGEFSPEVVKEPQSKEEPEPKPKPANVVRRVARGAHAASPRCAIV